MKTHEICIRIYTATGGPEMSGEVYMGHLMEMSEGLGVQVLASTL